MSKHRSRLEIILIILSAIRDGVEKPTHIMFAANMSWIPVQKKLSRMIEQNLILEILNTKGRQSKRRYLITEKGRRMIDHFEGVKEILPLAELYAGD